MLIKGTAYTTKIPELFLPLLNLLGFPEINYFSELFISFHNKNSKHLMQCLPVPDTVLNGFIWSSAQSTLQYTMYLHFTI